MDATTGTPQPNIRPSQQAKAVQLVSEYNKQAAALAVIVMQLQNLRAEIGDAGAGQVIVSADGWTKNALEVIPMLRIQGQDYPKQFPAGMLVDMRKQQASNHFDATKQAAFATPPGYTVTAESLLHHKAALDYAEQHGVDYITAAIKTDRGNE